MPATLNSIFIAHRHSLIWTVMRIVRDRQTAEDLAQETYLRARTSIETRPIEHIEAFLHQTARNLALDYLRRCKTRGRVEDNGIGEGELQNVPANVPSLETELLERERFRAFRQALAGLPERTQQVVLLSRIHEWPNTRIARHLDVSERTVFNELKRAMAHCREALARLDQL
jgi:RNA polymerase sigma factor (sigma-70 family)